MLTVRRVQALLKSNQTIDGFFTFTEKAVDPVDPAEGSYTMWMEASTGDIKVKITEGGVTKTATLVDFSAV